jgi:exopolysaccharide production repressor protein
MRGDVMGAPRVFVGMFGTLFVFFIASYFINGSITLTILDTIAAAVLLQVGYFLLVLFMVWRAAETRNALLEGEPGIVAGDDSHPATAAFEQSPPLGS